MRGKLAKLAVGEVWPHITSACGKRGVAKHIAISYLGSGAADLLRPSKGDCLITDLSDFTVESGAANLREALRALLEYDVTVYSVENLHAKAIVCGSTAIIGSTNASVHSANDLLEASLFTDDVKVVDALRKWIKNLRADEVGRIP